MRYLIILSLLISQAAISAVNIECFDKDDQSLEASAHIQIDEELRTLSLLGMNYYGFHEPIVYKMTKKKFRSFVFTTHLENSLKRTNLAPSRIEIPKKLLKSDKKFDVSMHDNGGDFKMDCKIN